MENEDKKPVGRPRGIETPEAMYHLFEAYKLNLNEQAKEWVKVQYVGKDGDKKEDNMKVPMTMEGFRGFGYTRGVTIKHYFDNQDDAYEDFCTICSRIKDEIRANQITGGLLGVFNPSITQRLNGLKEQSEVESRVTLNIPNLPDIGSRK